MQIPLPPGYKTLVPFDRNKHQALAIAEAKRGEFARELHGVQLFVAEFNHAARHYPIVFVSDTGTGKVLSLAVTGMDPGRNLFVDEQGRWEQNCYVPAYVRRWPFFTAHIEGRGTPERPESLVLVDEGGLGAEGEPLFDSAGKEGEPWRRADTLMRELESARAQHDKFIETLTTLRLLAPFEAHAFPKGGRDLHLVGMLRVDEERLNALDGKTVKRLMKKGELSRIYSHLTSLDNFRYLMDRSAAREASAAKN